MLIKKKIMLPGQNIRYMGRGFPGFIKGQPYMVFLGYLDNREISVSYNGVQTSVLEFFTEVLDSKFEEI